MIIGASGANKLYLIIFYNQLKKIQGRILEILMTALLESIDLSLLGQACITLTRTKSDPNDPDYPDDLTRLQRWNLVGHWVKISLNQSQVFTGSFSANEYTISFILA